MGKISQMNPPALPLSGLELVPALQGGDADSNVGVPLLAYGHLPRGDVLKLRVPMLADLSVTADADPGAGKVRWNNATPASATMLYIDDVDGNAGDVRASLAALGVGGFVYLQANGDSARRDAWQKWQVVSITDAAGYTKVGVAYQVGAGTFVDGEALELTVQQPSPSPGVNRNVVTAVASAGGMVTIDCSLGDYFMLALSQNVTGWTLTNVPAGASIMIEITQDATARTVAWPASFKWAGGAGSVSTGAAAKDVLAITTFNAGGAWKATLAKAFA